MNTKIKHAIKTETRDNKIRFILSQHTNLRNIAEDNYFLFRDFLYSEYKKMSINEINIEFEFYLNNAIQWDGTIGLK